MALNGSGPISLGGSTTGQSVNLELGLSATAQISFNDSAVRTLTDTRGGDLDPITMPTDFYDKFKPFTTFYTTPGTYTFIMPAQTRSLSAFVYGGGGGGGGAGNAPTAGTNGGTSSFSLGNQEATGGTGGAASTGGTTTTAPGGVGDLQGGSTNLNRTGGTGAAGSVAGGAGGIAYGGAGGTGAPIPSGGGAGGAATVADATIDSPAIVNTPGNSGTTPGGGGSGAARATTTCKGATQFGAGGGGGGGYSVFSWSIDEGSWGDAYTVIVGAGGAGGTAAVGPSGGAGAPGRVSILLSPLSL
jgi:hypothetical protein